MSNAKYGDKCTLSLELQAKFGSCLTKLSSHKDGVFVEHNGECEGYIYIDKQAGNTGSFYIAMNNQIISGKFDCNGQTNPYFHQDGILDLVLEVCNNQVVPAHFGDKPLIQYALRSNNKANLTKLYEKAKKFGPMGSLATLGAEADTASFWENHKNKFYIGGGIAMIAAVAAYGYKAFKERK